MSHTRLISHCFRFSCWPENRFL